jgi:hypothetical protein
MEWDLTHIKEMIERRITNTIQCSLEEIWGNLLPENCFEILAKHSTRKPRELIRLVSLCLNRAVVNGHKRVNNEDIVQALREYSVERIGDIVSEYRFTYPKLDIVVQKFFGKDKEFSFKILDEISTEIAVDALDHGNVGMPWQWAGGFDEHAEDFARLLVDIGFLLVKVNRTAPPQIYDPQMMGPINSSMWFAVHPMYAPGLRLLGT